MAANGHQSSIYVGLAGEGQFVGEGGLYRYGVADGTWQSVTKGLPEAPQVRALLIGPNNQAVVYAGTQHGVYRSDDRGEHWEPLGTPGEGRDVWSLAGHPERPDVLYAGYEPCGIERSEDGGASWERMDTSAVVFPHITTYMYPTAKRVISITADPTHPAEMYAAIEVGVPLRGAHRCQEPVHLLGVVEQRAVQMPRIPFEQHAADVPDHCVDANVPPAAAAFVNRSAKRSTTSISSTGSSTSKSTPKLAT